MPTPHPRSGFTLIELSIVLVIIGLIVGGILVGKDMIHAAEIRAQVSQIEKLNSAVNAFTLKYNCLPGDCPNATTALGFPHLTVGWEDAFNSSNGNGDGIIGSSDGGTLAIYENTAATEMRLIWIHLSAANLIGGYTGPGSGRNGMDPDYLPGAIPNTKVYALYVPSPMGANAFLLAGATLIGAEYSLGLTSGDAWAIDTKLDDGRPFTGTVIASSWGNWVPSSPLGADGVNPGPPNDCVEYAAANLYATSSAEYNVNCSLTFKMQAGQ